MENKIAVDHKKKVFFNNVKYYIILFPINSFKGIFSFLTFFLLRINTHKKKLQSSTFISENQDGKYIFKSKCIWRLVLSRGLHCSNVFTDIILSDSKCLCFIHFRISTKKLFSRNKLKRIHNKIPSYFAKFATILTLFCWITTSQTATQFISKAVIWANKVAINKHRPTKYDFGNSHVFVQKYLQLMQGGRVPGEAGGRFGPTAL